MSDKITFVPDNVRDAADSAGKSFKQEIKKGLKETLSQIFGANQTEVKKQEENSRKIAEKAEKSGRSVEEQAKIELLRKQLHQQVIARHTPSPHEDTRSDTGDRVGTNETNQQLGGIGNNNQSNDNGLPPLAQPNMRRGERLRIRE